MKEAFKLGDIPQKHDGEAVPLSRVVELESQ
jgi:hypothetical protein